MPELSLFQLQPIQFLFQKKQKELKDLVGRLKLIDVKEDAAFDNTKKRVKSLILLDEVEFEQPVFGDPHEEDRDSRGTSQNPFPHSRRVIILPVTYNFSGSAEVFAYSPDGMSFSSSSTRIKQPGYNNQISIDVEVPSLDKKLVNDRAKLIMETTFSIINQINPQLQQWSASMNYTIDQMLIAKRNELINFFR